VLRVGGLPAASVSHVPFLDLVSFCLCRSTGGQYISEEFQDLFTTPKVQQKDGNPQTQTQMVSIFLQGRSKVKGQGVVEMMYASRYSTPKAVRQSANRSASEAKRRDKEMMARWGLEQWTIEKVEKLVDEEAEMVSLKEGELHLANEDARWDFVVNFSLSKVLSVIETKGPMILRLFIAAAIPKGKRPIPRIHLPNRALSLWNLDKPATNVHHMSPNSKCHPLPVVGRAGGTL